MNRKTKNKQILSTPPPVLGVGALEKRGGWGEVIKGRENPIPQISPLGRNDIRI
jgi:hypothetical protein